MNQTPKANVSQASLIVLLGVGMSGVIGERVSVCVCKAVADTKGIKHTILTKAWGKFKTKSLKRD